MLKKRFCIFLILILYFFSAGCAAVVVGAGAGAAAVTWSQGKLEETIPATVPHLHDAIKAGLSDLNIKVTEDKFDDLIAKVRAELADGTKVWIDAESTGSSMTKMTIRVGYLGDKEFSLRIRDAIKKHL
jgi:hypothetical protein